MGASSHESQAELLSTRPAVRDRAPGAAPAYSFAALLTHLPWFLFPSIHGELARTLFMGAGWAINLAAVEWILLRERRSRSS